MLVFLICGCLPAGTASANATSSKPILGADGRTVIFNSFASDLVDRDFNANRDIFALRLGAGDADGDGLVDDWEMTYFAGASQSSELKPR